MSVVLVVSLRTSSLHCGLWFLLLFEIKQFWNHPQIFCVFQLHLSKLETAREDDINLEIHNVQCIYNALSDIKAEVENVIKVGRKIVETDEASHQVGGRDHSLISHIIWSCCAVIYVPNFLPSRA